MAKNKSKISKKTLRLVYIALFTAIIVVLTCLPLKAFTIEWTLSLIPIAVGAIVLGPVEGAILGGIYGVCSFLQCFGIFSPSPLGMALVSNYPSLTFLMFLGCFVPRILCGWITGLVYKALAKHDRTKLLSHAAACLVCPLLNTILFMTFTMIFFGQTDIIQGSMQQVGTTNPVLFVILAVWLNAVVEIASCVIIGTAASKALTVANKRILG